MQDLIINGAITWRRATQSEVTGGDGVVYAVLPPSPIRVAAYAWNVASVAVQQIRTGVSGIDAVSLPSADGASATSRYATIHLYPGIFSGPLYAAGGLTDAVWFEAVQDPALADAVSAGYSELLAAHR